MTKATPLRIDQTAHVWFWRPGTTAPVHCGRVRLSEGICSFAYSMDYLARRDPLPLYGMPLGEQWITPAEGQIIPGILRDAAPDQWGRRVVLATELGCHGQDVDTGQLDDLSCLLLSGSDRAGAIDIQPSGVTYAARVQREAGLDALAAAGDAVERGLPLTTDQRAVLRHAAPLGGARPKAQLNRNGRKFIVKFPASRDRHDVVLAEYLAMRLAASAGLDVAAVELDRAAGGDVLLVERFDRLQLAADCGRMAMVSSLTLQGLDENGARYASYEALAGVLRRGAGDPASDLRELWQRMLFNILIGNTDDHARNHACFWDGSSLRLTPAYDIDPRPRIGREANQAMAVNGQDRRARIATALAAAGTFGLRQDEAIALAKAQILTIQASFRKEACKARLPAELQDQLAGRAILNPYVFEDAPRELSALEGPF